MFEQNLTFHKTITMVTEICCSCGICFGIPSYFQDTLRNHPENGFYCPNGHKQHYSQSEEKKLRIKAENKVIEAEIKANNAIVEKIQIESQLKKANRDLNRLNNSICSCCNRSFNNLKQHMETMHPDKIGKPKRVYKNRK